MSARAEAFLADEVVSSVRHELLNRLMAIGATTAEIQQRLRADAEAFAPLFAAVQAHVAAGAGALERMHVEPPLDDPSCSLTEVIAEATALFRAKVTVHGPAAVVAGDGEELVVALACLVRNALEAADAASVSVIPRGDEVDVVVQNQGGPPAAELDRVFERYFTTKAGHLGLGLNVARRIARRWGGDVTLANAGGAVRATLSLRSLP